MANMSTPPDLEQLCDIDYFRSINPAASISDYPFVNDGNEVFFPDEQKELSKNRIKKDGYFQTYPLIDRKRVVSLAHKIDRLNGVGILPLYIAVYDEFWQFLQQVRNTFNDILGRNYLLTPDFWAWHVSPGASSRGCHIPILVRMDCQKNVLSGYH